MKDKPAFPTSVNHEMPPECSDYTTIEGGLTKRGEGMTPQERIKQIKERCEKATPGPWVWGDWDIFREDREAQKRGEPYWTLIEGSWNRSLCRGPIGRKVTELDGIARGDGLEESSISVSNEDAEFIAESRTDIPWLIERVEKLEGALNSITSYDLTKIASKHGDMVDFDEVQEAFEKYLNGSAHKIYE